MNCSEYRTLKEDIREIKKQNIEELLLVFKYCLAAYVDSVMTFGFNSNVSLDIIKFFKEFKSIIKNEKSMLNFLLENYFLVDIDEVNNFLCKLDDLNEETINYYYKFLDDVGDACDMGVEWKGKRPFKTFDTLVETDRYYKELCGLLLSFEDIKNYFNYEDDFWNYIDSKVYLVDDREYEDKGFYGVNMKCDDDNKLEELKIFVPNIINLETALINVHEFRCAYDLYKLIGKKVELDETFCEKVASDSEFEFRNEYINKKLKKVFFKKY